MNFDKNIFNNFVTIEAIQIWMLRFLFFFHQISYLRLFLLSFMFVFATVITHYLKLIALLCK